MYFECTYNGELGELYIDAYKKWKNYKVDAKDFDLEAHIQCNIQIGREDKQ